MASPSALQNSDWTLFADLLGLQAEAADNTGDRLKGARRSGFHLVFSVSSRQFFGWTTIIIHPWIDLLLLDFFQQSATPIKVRLVDVGVTPKLNKVSTEILARYTVWRVWWRIVRRAGGLRPNR